MQVCFSWFHFGQEHGCTQFVICYTLPLTLLNVGSVYWEQSHTMWPHKSTYMYIQALNTTQPDFEEDVIDIAKSQSIQVVQLSPPPLISVARFFNKSSYLVTFGWVSWGVWLFSRVACCFNLWFLTRSSLYPWCRKVKASCITDNQPSIL